ncbi:MAG: M50 family metallopeptidase [Mariniblastus sp.]|nr:M50 family metallopeptidase [Mariniblastus sp.]MDG2180917.1 M50 family metallopeptidase [Mariniblastus sp.]
MRIAGIDVHLHWTFWLVPVCLVCNIFGFGEQVWFVTGVSLFLLLNLSFCVLLHELGHALVARRFGATTKDIIIAPFGGLARLTGMPKNPGQEFLISFAGPAVNLVIALLFAAGIIFAGGSLIPPSVFESLNQLPLILLWINLVLFLLNLIPAFPMDGGRMLRSILARRMSYLQATVIAGRVGQFTALFFSFYVALEQQFLLLPVGIFLFLSAQFELNRVRASEVNELERDSAEADSAER